MTSDPLRSARDWLAAGHRVALARVVRTWGSSPCPPGSLLAVNDAGAFEGSVSGGCVETAVIEAARQVMDTGRHEVLEFGITDERAWEVGLACGGTVRILVESAGEPGGTGMDMLDRVLAARRGGGAVALLTALADGRRRLVPLAARPRTSVTDEESAAIDAAATTGRCSVVAGADGDVFVQVFQQPVRLVIVGAVHIAQHLAAQALACGFDVVVVDPRTAFTGADRFRGVRVVNAWPAEVMAQLRPDARTAVVVLSHDPKLDDPALASALASEAFYIGALGSRKNHAARRERLRAHHGHADAVLDRIHGPIGLDIGASSPAEIAISIMAEIIQSRRT